MQIRIPLSLFLQNNFINSIFFLASSLSKGNVAFLQNSPEVVDYLRVLYKYSCQNENIAYVNTVSKGYICRKAFLKGFIFYVYLSKEKD